MKLLHESYFQAIYYAEESSLLMMRWKPTTSEMTEEKHLVELHTLFMYARRIKPDRFLLDAREKYHYISADGQLFFSNLFKDHSASYLAIVTKENPEIEDEFKKLFMHFEEVASHSFTIRYYKDYEAALAWILA